jgi:hypothetical protein
MRVFLTLCGLTGMVASLAGCSGGAADSGLVDICPEGCQSGLICQQGKCVTPCAAAGGLLCGTVCVDALTDNANCGSCGVTCPQGQVCSAGLCGTTCATGYAACPPDAGTYCANLSGDVFNCGSCGNACAPQEYCSGGTCRPGSCPVGQTLCGADGGHPTCSDLQGDNNNCGVCGKACPAGASCLGGTCQSGPTCTSGLVACTLGDGGVACTDTRLDPDNCGGCGKSCGTDGVCHDGACSCPGLYTQCGTPGALFCAETQLDVNNCGACNYTCVRCESCATGACTPNRSLFLEPPTPFPPTTAYYNSTIALADLNGDGYLDAVTVTSNYSGYYANAVSLYWGGDGGFGGPTIFGIGDPMTESIPVITVADFNHDGVPDLAVALEEYADGGFNEQGGYWQYATLTEVIVYLNVPGGGFVLDDGGLDAVGPVEISYTSYYGDYVIGMAPMDIDGDGLLDLVVLGETSGLTGLYQTAGGFNAAAIPTGINFLSYDYGSIAVGDVDGDGRNDLVIGVQPYNSPNLSGVVGVMQVSDGGLTMSATTSIPIAVYSSGPAVAISPDGLINVMADELRTFRFAANSGLTDVGDFLLSPFPFYYYYYYGPVAADFNGDGLTDLAFSTYSGIAVFLRNDAGYDFPAVFPVNAYSSSGIAAAPLNGDSRPDIAFVGYGQNGGAVLRNNSASCSP